MDVNRFLADNYSNEDLAQIFAPPKSKVESLVNLVEKAKKAKVDK
jgi:hypothetical protein